MRAAAALEERESEHATLSRVVAANLIGQGWTAVSGFLFVPIYIRMLGVEAYGVIGFFTVLQASLSLLDLGMTPTISRQLARYASGAIGERDALSLVRGLTMMSLAIGLLIILGLIIAAPFLATDWFTDARIGVPELHATFRGIAVVIGLRFCESLFRGAMIGLERQILLNVLLVIFATLRNGGVVIAMLVYGATLTVFFGYQAWLSALVLLSFALAVQRCLSRPIVGRFSWAPIGSSLGFTGGMFVISIFSLIITQADKLILSRIIPLAEYSSYMLAVTLGGALPLIVGPIAQAVYPRFIRFVEERDEARLASLYHLASQATAALIVPVVMVSALYPRDVIFGWSGNGPLAGSMRLIFPLILIGTGMNSLFWMPYYAQLAMGRVKFLARYNGIAAVLVIGALLAFARPFGALAGASVWLLLNLSYLLVVVPILHRQCMRGHAFRWYMNTIALPTGASFMVAAALRAFAPVRDDRAGVLAFLAAAYVLSMIASAMIAPDLRRAAFHQGRRLLSRRQGRMPVSIS